jgi:hypothetical protein
VDVISPTIIKISLPFTISPIKYVCNKMLRDGAFPDILKYAIIRQLYKNGDSCNVSYYRPMSLPTSF